MISPHDQAMRPPDRRPARVPRADRTRWPRPALEPPRGRGVGEDVALRETLAPASVLPEGRPLNRVAPEPSYLVEEQRVMIARASRYVSRAASAS